MNRDKVIKRFIKAMNKDRVTMGKIGLFARSASDKEREFYKEYYDKKRSE